MDILTLREQFSGDDAAFIAYWHEGVLVGYSDTVLPLDRLERFLIATGLRTTLEQAATAHEDSTVRTAAKGFLDFLASPRFQNLVFTDPLTMALLPVLRAGGLVSDELVAAAKAFDLPSVPRWQAEGISEPTQEMLDVARRSQAGERLRVRCGAAQVRVAEKIAAYERGEVAAPSWDELASLWSVTE